MWNSRSPGVATAVCLATLELEERVQPGRRGSPNSRSHRSEPIPTTQVSSASGTRKPTERLQPADVGQQIADDPLAAGLDRDDEEDRGLGQRREDGLWLRSIHDSTAFCQRSHQPDPVLFVIRGRSVNVA